MKCSKKALDLNFFLVIYLTNSGNNYEKRSGNTDNSEAGEDTVILMKNFPDKEKSASLLNN